MYSEICQELARFLPCHGQILRKPFSEIAPLADFVLTKSRSCLPKTKLLGTTHLMTLQALLSSIWCVVRDRRQQCQGVAQTRSIKFSLGKDTTFFEFVMV